MHNLHIAIATDKNVQHAICQLQATLEDAQLTDNNWYNIDCIINITNFSIECNANHDRYPFNKNGSATDIKSELNNFVNAHLQEIPITIDTIIRDLTIARDTKDVANKNRLLYTAARNLEDLAERELFKNSDIDIFYDEYFPYDFTRFGVTHLDSYSDMPYDNDIYVMFIDMHS